MLGPIYTGHALLTRLCRINPSMPDSVSLAMPDSVSMAMSEYGHVPVRVWPCPSMTMSEYGLTEIVRVWPDSVCPSMARQCMSEYGQTVYVRVWSD